MLLRYMDHDVHILQLLLLFCTLVMKLVNLRMKVIANRHVSCSFCLSCVSKDIKSFWWKNGVAFCGCMMWFSTKENINPLITKRKQNILFSL